MFHIRFEEPPRRAPCNDHATRDECDVGEIGIAIPVLRECHRSLAIASVFGVVVLVARKHSERAACSQDEHARSDRDERPRIRSSLGGAWVELPFRSWQRSAQVADSPLDFHSITRGRERREVLAIRRARRLALALRFQALAFEPYPLAELRLEREDSPFHDVDVLRFRRGQIATVVLYRSVQVAERLVRSRDVVEELRIGANRVCLLCELDRFLEFAVPERGRRIRHQALEAILVGASEARKHERREHEEAHDEHTHASILAENVGIFEGGTVGSELLRCEELVTTPPRISHYECLGRLAIGGMAEILLARVSGPNGFERPVVIKRILPHLASVPEFRQMFLDEARIVARIRDDNVVQVHELGCDGDELFLVMEYLEGESIGGLLRRLVARDEALDPWLACHIVAETAAGLHTAHELASDSGAPLGLVHRDISPQNVFVTYAGRVKLLDFGIAKVADRTVRTATGQLKGKFQYMSPEQCLGKPLDRRSDIWALGVLLYELTTLSQPFKRANELLTFKAICEDPLPRPGQGRVDYPICIEPIVIRALSRDPDLRFATAKDMRRALLSAARELEGSGEVGDALATLMEREFGERRQDKHVMLSNATRGTDIGVVPPAEVDEQVELPAITEMASSVVATQPHAPRNSRRNALALVALFAVLGVIALGYAFSPRKESQVGAPANVSELATPPASTSAPAPSASVATPRTSASVSPKAVQRTKPTLATPRKSAESSEQPKPPIQVPVW